MPVLMPYNQAWLSHSAGLSSGSEDQWSELKQDWMSLCKFGLTEERNIRSEGGLESIRKHSRVMGNRPCGSACSIAMHPREKSSINRNAKIFTVTTVRTATISFSSRSGGSSILTYFFFVFFFLNTEELSIEWGVTRNRWGVENIEDDSMEDRWSKRICSISPIKIKRRGDHLFISEDLLMVEVISFPMWTVINRISSITPRIRNGTIIQCCASISDGVCVNCMCMAAF